MGSGSKIVISSALLVVSIVVGGWVRVYWLDRSPATVNWDEAALGYNAYSLLHTGRDEYGVALPISLQSFDDYKPAVYAYLATVPVALGGLTEITTRLPSVIFGALLIFVVYYLGIKLTGNRWVGLSSAVVIATSPWSVHMSRIAFEANVAMVVYVIAVALVVKGDKYMATVMAVVAMYTYHAPRAIALPTIIIIGWIVGRRLNWKHLTLAMVMLIPLIINFVTAPIGARLAATNIFKLWPFVPEGYNWWLFSPLYSLMWAMVGHYLAYLSPATLFWRGSTEPILRIPGVGLFIVELLPVWLIGWWALREYRKLLIVVLALMVITPLPAVVTWNWFSLVRSLAIYPVWALVIGVGMAKILRHKVLATLVIMFLIPGTLYGLMTTILYYPVETAGEFQPGFEQSARQLVALERTANQVIVDSPQIAPYIFVLFYSEYSPAKYLAESKDSPKQSRSDQHTFGKWKFRKIDWEQDKLRPNTVLMGSVSALPGYKVEEWQKEGIVKNTQDFYDSQGFVSFRMVELL